MNAPSHVVVFACGDPLRGDDGAARAAVRALPPSTLSTIQVRQQRAVGVDDLLDLPPDLGIVIVDTVMGVPAGRLVAFDLRELPVHTKSFRPGSTHQLPMDQVVAMAIVFGSGVTGSFVGMGGADFGLGRQLSPAVRRAIPALAAAIVSEVARLSDVLSTSGAAT